MEREGPIGCKTADPSAISDYILHSYPDRLFIRTHNPTYACSYTGTATDYWQELVDIRGDSRLFAVNDCNKQVSSAGKIVPCGTGTPDKFAIIGFTRFSVGKVLRGDDPAAIGTPGTPAQGGTCSSQPLGLRRDGTRNLAALAGDSCGASDGNAIDVIPYGEVIVTSHDGTVTYTKCPPSGGTGCAYLYDESAFTITWVDAATKAQPGKQVSFNWTIDGTPATPGLCGVRSADPNSICLVLKVP